MNTLIINGSPRKNGDTAFLLNELRKNIDGEVKSIDTYSIKVSPCVDCRFCWENESCSIDDEMNDIFNYIDNSDNIIIASPIYFSELTGSLLNLGSRLQYLWVSKNIRNAQALRKKTRNGFIILVGGGDGKIDKALSTAKCLLAHMGAVLIDAVISHNTNNIPAKEDSTAILGIQRIAGRINKYRDKSITIGTHGTALSNDI